MKIQTLLRAQDVTRWNIVHTMRKQSLAEHLFNTAMIASHICEMLDWDLDCETRAAVVDYALRHDIDEIISGDIPSPTKRKLKAMGVDINAMVQITDMVMPTPLVLEIVKAADLLENLWYIEQYGHGRHATEVKVRLHAELFDAAREGNPVHVAAKQIYHDMTHGEVEI